MHGNDNKWYLNQFRWFWSLFSINRKQSPGGAWVGKFKKILQKLWYLHYLTTFRGGLGIKISGTTQGLWNSCSFALKFDYVSIKYKKLQKIKLFFASFEHISSFFNFHGILAQKTVKFKFPRVSLFFWHPFYLWIWLSSPWKKFKTFLAVCPNISRSNHCSMLQSH